MSATARLVVQMTPDEKRRLEAKARGAGLTTSEFVRQRVSDEGIGEVRPEIEALLRQLERSAPAILAGLDRTIAEAEAALDDIRRRQDR